MRSATAIVAVLAIGLGDTARLAGAQSITAQPDLGQVAPIMRPDFSGLWTMDNSRSESAAQESPPGVVTVMISQTGSALGVKTTRDGKTDTRVYPIGSPPATPTQVSGELSAFWDGASLINEGAANIEGQTVAFQERRTSAANGKEMVVETTLKVEHGYLLRGAQTIVTGKNIYIRERD